MTDLRPPDDWHVVAQPGWPLASSVERELAFPGPVRLGSIDVPQAFQVFVMPAPMDQPSPTWGVTLMYLVDSAGQEINLTMVLAGGLEVDEALALLSSRRPLTWWKRYALVALAVDEAERGAEIVNDLRMTERADAPDTAGGPSDSTYWEHQDRLIARATQAAMRFPVHRRRNKITDGHLREVANIYRQAWRAGAAPTKAVAEHFHVAHSSAARWVGMARKAGHLRPADGSRGGESDE